MDDPASIPTRASLLARLKDCADQDSWREFFERYWRLLHVTALKAGLTESEAQEVVQEVVITAARRMPEFTYTPGKDSFKGWLLAVTRWKIADQFRKRARASLHFQPLAAAPPDHDEPTSVRTLTDESVAAPDALESFWESEWRENLLRTALGRVKRKVNPSHYEIYHLHVLQGHSARETATALGVSTPAVHLAKLRVGRLMQRELAHLRNLDL